MTRKDYELIAKSIKTYLADNGNHGEARLLAYAIAETLRQTNPRFDKQRFLQACNLG